MIVIVVCTFICIALSLIENCCHQKNIRKIPIRILVNGTRGKSSVVRLINAAFNNCGIKCMAKSTGSEAYYINSDLSQTPINRRFGKNMVREQRILFKNAVKNNCKAVVCECSAVRPENQVLYAEKLVKPTHVIITNIRRDHIDQMGDNPEEVILLSVPDNAELIKTDKAFEGSIEGFGFKVHPQNIQTALEVCKRFGLNLDKALEGMKSAKGDMGMTGNLSVLNHTIVNGFAVNDAESAEELFKGLELNNVTAVFANRADREYRIKEFSSMFKKLGIRDIVVIGDNRKKASRIIGARTYGRNEFKKLLNEADKILVCCGNIVGSGESFLNFCKENGK